MSTTGKEILLEGLSQYFDAIKRKIAEIDDSQLRADLLNATGTDLINYEAELNGVKRSVTSKLRDIVTGADYVTAQAASDKAFNKAFFVPEATELKINVPDQLPTLSAAIDAIGLWVIPKTSMVTIDIKEGEYTTTSPIVISHPFAERITINGPTMGQNATLTGIQSVTGTRGNYLVKVGISSTTGMKVGTWLFIRECAGTAGPYKIFNGCYQVTEVGTGTITIRVRLWQDTFPAITLTSGLVYIFKAVIKAINCDGLVIRSSSPTMNFILFVGNMYDYWDPNNVSGTEKGTHGIYIGSNTINSNGQPAGENPYGISGGSLSGRFMGAVDFDQQGFTAAGSSSIYGRYFISSSCGRRGFYVGTASGMEVKFSVSSTHYLDAVIADYGGTFNTSNFEGNGCRVAGAFANNGGSIVAPDSNFWANSVANIDIRGGCFGGFSNSTLRYSPSDGARFEYGAAGSLVNVTISDNASDGLSGYYSSAVRMLNAVISNNGRYGVNIMGADINLTGTTVVNNGVANHYLRGWSNVFDGVKLLPVNELPPFKLLEITNSDNSKSSKFTVTSIGDLDINVSDGNGLVLKADGTTYPKTDTATMGRNSDRFKTTYSVEYIVGQTGIKICSDVGSPEGKVMAPVGSTYHRVDGGPGSTFYVKESGTAAIGWIAK